MARFRETDTLVDHAMHVGEVSVVRLAALAWGLGAGA